MRGWGLVLCLVADCAPVHSASQKDDSAEALAAVADARPANLRAIERLPSSPREGSSIALGRVGDATLAFVSDPDGAVVRMLDLDRNEELSAISIPRSGQILVLADGRIAALAGADDSVRLLRLDGHGVLECVGGWPTGRGPVSMAISPDDATLVVVTDGERTLETYRIADGQRMLRVPVGEGPRAVATSADGTRALVAHATTSDVDVVELPTGAVHREVLSPPAQEVEPAGVDISEDGGKTWQFGNGMVTAHLANELSAVRLPARHGVATASRIARTHASAAPPSRSARL